MRNIDRQGRGQGGEEMRRAKKRRGEKRRGEERRDAMRREETEGEETEREDKRRQDKIKINVYRIGEEFVFKSQLEEKFRILKKLKFLLSYKKNLQTYLILFNVP